MLTEGTNVSHRIPKAICVVAVFIVLAAVGRIHSILEQFPAYRSLHSQYPYYFVENIDKLGGVALCLLAVWLLRRMSGEGLARELGLVRGFLPAVVFGLVVTLPLLVGFALTSKIASHWNVPETLFLTVLSSTVEEIEFRGLGVRVLQRVSGWPFWIAVWPQVLLFGLGHIEKGQNLLQIAGLFLLTGTGGVLFAWLNYRWRSLWFPIAVHVLTNFWWAIFKVSDNALGGWFAFILELISIAAAIAITLRWNGNFNRESDQDKTMSKEKSGSLARSAL